MAETGPSDDATVDLPWLSATTDELGALDQAIFDAIATTPTPTLDRLLVAVSDAADYSRIWMAVAVGMAATGGRPGRRAAVSGVLGVALASAVTNVGLKPLAGRRRPKRRDGAAVADSRRVRPTVSTSFPSGHTASAFAFAAAAARSWPAASPPLHAAAALVGYSRVHTGMHFPSDVAAGAVVGALCGRAAGGLTAAAVRNGLAAGPGP